MKKSLLACLFIVLLFNANGQLSHGGMPWNWNDKHLLHDIPFVNFAEVNRETLAQEDAVTDQFKEAPYRFGVEYDVNYAIENSGRWITDDNSGHSIWQLGIYCPGAINISLRFDQFVLPKGAQLFIWSADREEFIGAFTHQNSKESGILATGLIHGEKIIIEYSVPTSLANWGQLQIGQVVHGYREFALTHFTQVESSYNRGPFGSSGNCEVNINCPEGADWQIEKKAVAIIVEGGSGICTGALVNNTAQDGTPYFLTANHCLGNVGAWVFYFNHESSSCTGFMAPTTQSISGSTEIASSSYSDFGLLLLDDTPPAAWNVQYAGWDATDSESAVNSAVCIHHPSGDIKKISFEDDAPYHSVGNGAQVWWIDNWELGVTEPGSSGSPLFNQDHRIIGQLFGGASACNGSSGNGQYDFYGRFGQSWDHGATAGTRLQDWLDPLNTGQTVLDGYPEGFVSLALDAGASGIDGVESSVCGSIISPVFNLHNFGSTTLTSCIIHYQLNNGTEQTINWNGSLAQYGDVAVNIPVLDAANGNNTLTIWVTNPNNSTDENSNNNQTQITFTASTAPVFIFNINIILDNYPEETSWEIVNGNNQVVYSSNGTYENEADGSTVEISGCLPEACYTFTMLDDSDDGICCDYGIGSYMLTNNNNVAVASGGEFAAFESTEFCMGNLAIAEKSKAEARIFPNPANDQLSIISDQKIQKITLFDITGREVFTQSANQNNLIVNTSAFPTGTYTLVIQAGENRMISRTMIVH
jgi:lysyl endopeptidase